MSTQQERAQAMQRVKELDAAATKGPWALTTVRTQVGKCHKIGVFPARGVHPTTSACVYEDGMSNTPLDGPTELRCNAELMAESRALLPQLAAMLSESEEERDVLTRQLLMIADELTAALQETD